MPTKTKEMKEYKLNITEEEFRTIFKALGKMPFEDVFQLIEKLNLQMREQQSAN